MNNHFIFIGYWPDYEELFIRQTASDNITLQIANPRHIWNSKNNSRYLKWLNKPFRAGQERKIIQQIFSRNPSSVCIVPDSFVPLDALCRFPKIINAHILMRNTLQLMNNTSKQVLKAQKMGYPVWSFDQHDCQQYDFHFYNQFIERISEINNIPIKYDLLFIGLDKGRLSLLKAIQNIANQTRLKCHLDIRSKNKCGVGHHLNYLEFLKIECSSQCIIDIVKEGQAGLTLRPLEAALYQRKLLTNNSAVVELPFYHADNILFFHDINDINAPILQDFLAKPLSPINPDTLKPFKLTALLTKFDEYDS